MRRLIFVFIMIIVSIHASSTVTQLLKIYLRDGSIITYPFLEKPVITFDEKNLILTTNEIVVTYPLINFCKYTINETDDAYNLRDITINNDELVSYVNETNIENCNITYIRTFDDTEWQSLYVPFEIKRAQLQEDFEIATINNFHQYDDDNNGIFDRTVLEIKKVMTDETLLPNYPYLIRAKNTGQKKIEINNTTLYAAEIFSIDCSSIEIKYAFTGTYSTIDNIRTLGYYYISQGCLNRPISETEKIEPFRWYMTMESRGSQFKDAPIIVNSNKIQLRIIEDEEITNVANNNITKDSIVPVATYSVNGQKVTKTSTKGVYIMQMSDGSTKKILIK